MTRTETLAEIADIERRWPDVVKPHDRAVSEAEAAVKSATLALRQAEQKLAEARSARSAARWPLDHRRDFLLASLERLDPPQLVAAIEHVEAVRERNRNVNGDAEECQRAAAATTWALDTRRQLHALRFVPDVVPAVERLMATAP